jgi:ribose-phosphate pyrophosphokinase
VIVGPDAESGQWVSRIAAQARCPYVVLTKRRLGDRRVALDLPNLSPMRGRKPVLVDDIISSAATMIEAARLLAGAGLPRPICVGIHGLFAGGSFKALSAVAENIVTTNTVAHSSNAIDLSEPIAAAVIEMAQGVGTRTAAP